MSWSAVKTWAVGDPMTAADLNTYLRDNLNYLVTSGGSMQPTGGLHNLGPSAQGGAGSHVAVGQYDAADAIVAAAGSATDIALLVQSQGAGSVVMRNGGDTSKYLSVTSTGKLLTNQSVSNLVSTVGAAGGASALPASPVGYMIVTINGTDRKIPYYNT